METSLTSISFHVVNGSKFNLLSLTGEGDNTRRFNRNVAPVYEVNLNSDIGDIISINMTKISNLIVISPQVNCDLLIIRNISDFPELLFHKP